MGKKDLDFDGGRRTMLKIPKVRKGNIDAHPAATLPGRAACNVWPGAGCGIESVLHKLAS
jgi:hypothetical protein